MKRRLLLRVLAPMTALLVMVPAGAVSADPVVSEPIVSGLITPLGLAVGSDGTLYVSQSFAGTLSSVKNGVVKDIAFSPDPNAFIAGVAAKGKGTVTYTVSGFVEATGDYIGLVQRVLPNGKVKTLGDPGTHEETENPDQVNSYGFQDLDDECAAELPDGLGYPFPGVVDSNSYAVVIMPDGSFMVADAGGNDIVHVARNGRVSTLAVLPPLPEVVTAEAAALFGLPECTVGATYNFDPVPTDVELGPDGMLYVSSLPGGPEDDTLGARGRVYMVHPSTGAVTEVASGFLGAVDLAVAPDGTIYVAELFAGKISKVVGGAPELVAEVTEPAAVEWANGKLYATINTFGDGSIVTITP